MIKRRNSKRGNVFIVVVIHVSFTTCFDNYYSRCLFIHYILKRLSTNITRCWLYVNCFNLLHEKKKPTKGVNSLSVAAFSTSHEMFEGKTYLIKI